MPAMNTNGCVEIANIPIPIVPNPIPNIIVGNDLKKNNCARVNNRYMLNIKFPLRVGSKNTKDRINKFINRGFVNIIIEVP